MNAEQANTAEKTASKIDWRAIGRFVAIMVKLFSHVTEVFKKIGTGPEILEWITGDGKEVFEKQFLMPLAIRFGGPDKERFMTVDLDAAPDNRCNESEQKPIQRHHRSGTVLLERRGDDLYADGKKITLYFSPRQKNEQGLSLEELNKELHGRKLPNVNLIYALFDNQGMVPEPWKNFGVIYCLGTLWHHDGIKSGKTTAQLREMLWSNEPGEKWWTIETDYLWSEAGQYPVLVFEE